MIEKIISDAQSGPAIAALDVAFKLGLEYGGWCHDGQPVAEKYLLERLSDATQGSVGERSVGAAHGTLFFTHATSTSLALESIKKIALRLNKPFLIVNLVDQSGFSASQGIAGWISENRIKVLHVDGEGHDPLVATADQSVAKVLEAAFFLSMMDAGITSPMQSVSRQTSIPVIQAVPETLEAAVNHLERTLSLKDRATIANMTADELVALHATLGDYINTNFDLFTTNVGLLKDCQRRSGQTELAPTDAAAIIIRALWDRLRATCRIRRVK